jgi:membrane fusion protein, multidrug efflux system
MNHSISPALRAITMLSIASLATVGLWAAIRGDEVPSAATKTAIHGLEGKPVESSAQPGLAVYDGVVQAVRHTVIAAQVSGAVVSLDVKPGDSVKAGQMLVRLDARAAEQTAAAGAAEVRAAHAALDAAQREYERQKQLLEMRFISQAAFDRAEAQFKSAQADSAAKLASAGAARSQSDFHVMRAPYAGIVTEVPVVLGDMALPGRPLMTMYDPSVLRVSAAVPQTAVAKLLPQGKPWAEVPGAGGRIEPVHVQLLPAVDAATHTQELRLELPHGMAVAAPGMFARVWLPVGEAAQERLFVPTRAVLHRAELTAVYVLDPRGRPLLRQVRLGRPDGERIEVLSGVSANERVALDPYAAAGVR